MVKRFPARAHGSRRLEAMVEGCQAHAGRISYALHVQRMIEMSTDPGACAPELRKTICAGDLPFGLYR
jgi:hypothetical protein